MKYFITFSFLIICCINSCVQNNINLSDYSWDTSINQITRTLGRPKETENVKGIIYNTYWNTKFYSYNADITFIFMNDKLVGGTYDVNSSLRIKSEKFDRNYYINTYNNIKNNLIKEYGNPLDSKEIPLLNMGNEKGKDVLLRTEMPVYSTWYSDGTMITLVFQYKGNWTILYSMFTQEFLDSQ